MSAFTAVLLTNPIKYAAKCEECNWVGKARKTQAEADGDTSSHKLTHKEETPSK